jgi:hypothetical protein
LAAATALSLFPLAASRRMAARRTRCFSSLRDRRRASSFARCSSDKFKGARFVTNGINHSATTMISLYSFQQNVDLVAFGRILCWIGLSNLKIPFYRLDHPREVDSLERNLTDQDLVGYVELDSENHLIGFPWLD